MVRHLVELIGSVKLVEL
jgi:hypothetical protein